MRFLRQNTAVIITVGPFYDKTDGVTIETGLTITNERITLTADTDDGSAPTNILDNVTGATTGTSNDLNYITGNDAGMMQMELSAANTNRVGRMLLSITDAANHVPVFHELFVLPQAIYDWFTGVIVPLPANVTTIAGSAVSVTTAQFGVNVVNAAGTAWGSGAITAASVATGAITNAKFAAGAIDAAAIANGAIDNATFAADVGSTAYATNIIALAADKAVVNAALATQASVNTIDDFLDTEVAAILAAVDTEVAAIKTKTDYLPSATAGAAGGLFIAGSNAATSITTALTANITGNLSGSVGSVTGAVGSVTGAVGSVTGAVGSVTGAVGSVAANGITATSIATDAINAAAVKADAVTKIQNGLATPTNITAGTITTATNVTTVNGLAAGVITAAAVATGAIDADALAADAGTEIGTAVWATAARTLTAATNITSTGGTTVPQTGDSFARLGAPAGVSVSADVAAIKSDTAAILTDTGTTLDTLIKDIPTVAEFEARTLVAADYTVVSDLGTVQTGDSFARLGAPAGASVSADVAAVKAQTAAIEADTQDLQTQVGTDGAGLTALPWNAAWDAEVQSECADAITAAAPIQADIRKVNNVTIDGAGTEGDPWGPAA